MPHDALLALGVILAATLTAFSVSAAIGLVMGRFGLDELGDSRGAEPATLGRRAGLTGPDPSGGGCPGPAPTSAEPGRHEAQDEAGWGDRVDALIV